MDGGIVVNSNEEEGELVGGNCDMLEINGRCPIQQFGKGGRK